MSIPTITFVNHASVIFSYNTIHMITDPWLFGPAFNDGWELLSKTKLSVDDFDKITHIWFSHEHPDHFSTYVLKSIPEKYRKKIIVLFQKTLDHRVVNFCRKLGFTVHELEPNNRFNVAENFSVLCGPNGIYDSWIFLKIGDLKILNLNDCMVDSYDQAHHVYKITGNVDVLLTQFGYASWAGDPKDIEFRKNAAKEKLNRIKIQAEVFKPRFIIPFASFIRFSHIDNIYMNNEVNKIEDVNEFINTKTNSSSIILYPGDKWEIGTKHDITSAITRYKKDASIEHAPYDKSPIIPLENLKKVSENYLKKIHEHNNSFAIRVLHWISYFKTAKIFLKDHESPVTFDLINGINEGKFSKQQADIIIDSDSLSFALTYDYGADTLFVNARFRTSGGNIMNFFRLFFIGLLNNNGRTFPLGVIGFIFKEKSMWKTNILQAVMGNYPLE